MIVEKVKAVRAKRKSAKKSASTSDATVQNSARVVDFYSKTYPYVFCVPAQCNANEHWSKYPTLQDGTVPLTDWCAEQSTKQYRCDVSRVTPAGHISSEYMFDDTNGVDAVFLAFEDLQDFSCFCLRWGYVAS